MRISLLTILLSLLVSTIYAQWEFTLATGASIEGLSLAPPSGGSLAGFEESQSSPGLLFSGQVGYRLNEKWSLRTRVAFVERNREKGTLLLGSPNAEVTANYIDVSAEAAYYFNPHFSVAFGGGPAILTSHTIAGSFDNSTIDEVLETDRTFARTGIAIEGHLRNFDARLEQTFGLSNARNELLQFTDVNGAPIGAAEGSWNGLMLTVGYRFMLGSERYDPKGSLDSFFIKNERRFQAKNPRLSMDVGLSFGYGGFSPSLLFDDSTEEVLSRSAAALRFDYQLSPKWSALSAIEIGRVVNDLVLDSVNLASTPIEQARSFGLRAGMRYQPFKSWGVSADIASASLFDRELTDNAAFYTIEELSPLRSTQFLGSITCYLTVDRWEFFGRISYTLNKPYTEALDNRFESPKINQNRFADIQAGLNYRIFRKRSS